MIPAARQRVRVTGLDDTFLVIDVDHELKCAFLTLVAGPPETVTVPFEHIEPDHASHMPAIRLAPAAKSQH